MRRNFHSTIDGRRVCIYILYLQRAIKAIIWKPHNKLLFINFLQKSTEKIIKETVEKCRKTVYTIEPDFRRFAKNIVL